MARLEWERANVRDRQRAAKRKAAKALSNEKRAAALAQYAARHRLTCFKCGKAVEPWAKTGVSARGPWAICAPCVSQPSG